MRIRRWHGKWQVIRRKLYGHIEVIYTAASEAECRDYIQRYG
jgi:hypothetical protein